MIVITYGTFDLFHIGHFNLIKRAKALGDFLIVGVTSDNYNLTRGKLNVTDSLTKRIEEIKKTGLADLIIVEDYEGQKIDDIKKFNVKIFTIGSDWTGKFDYLKKYCKVIYLERTKNVSSTQLRRIKFGIIKLGIIGYGRIVDKFIDEIKNVSGIETVSIFGLDSKRLFYYSTQKGIPYFYTDFNQFLESCSAVYVASPHQTHFDYVIKSLNSGKHVLCEKPLTLTESETIKAYEVARENKVVLLEAIKTAFFPAFSRLISITNSGIIGEIVNIESTFTKLSEIKFREHLDKNYGGSLTELSSYSLFLTAVVLGTNFTDIQFFSKMDNVDIFTKIILKYSNALSTINLGLGVKGEGSLVVFGTKGYIYVDSPWWKPSNFEVCFEDSNLNKKYFFEYQGEGLRYEIAEFVKLIQSKKLLSEIVSSEYSIFISKVIELYMNNKSKISHL
jgi:glycerol-3-phosphate cytidylyltransferase